MGRGMLALAPALLLAATARGSVIFSEVMYHSPHGSEHDYIEIHNAGSAAVDIGGWSLADGAVYTFPGATVIPADGYLVVCADVDAARAAYPDVPPALFFGNWTGDPSHRGDLLTLKDGGGNVQESFIYSDVPPWEFLADGYGASLERVCSSASANLAENWTASDLPPEVDMYGGTPGAPNGPEECPPAARIRPRILITEIMYHPVKEHSLVDDHEFIEIWNGEAQAVSLAGWRIAGGVDYAFPPDAAIPAGACRVIAKNRAALLAIPSYALGAGDVFGDYERELDNGGEAIAIVGPDGQGVDAVRYDDDTPWPVCADALGAEEEWLRPALLPVMDHQYRGCSLERVSVDRPSQEIANWTASPVDGATPARPNASTREVPLPIVEDLDVEPAAGGALIRNDDDIWIQALFAPPRLVLSAQLQWFIDDVTKSGEAISTLPMYDDGRSEGDREAGDDIFSAMIPPQKDASIIRFRIRADWGDGMQVISPRATDPNEWHACFVTPRVDTTTPIYQIYISPANWGQMWTNAQGGRVSGCAPRAAWDAEVPAILICEGEVIDVLVRYQGSRWNRTNGPGISTSLWPSALRPPSPLYALSWHIRLPRYAQLEGKSVITLNKLTQGCPGYTAGVGYRLFEAADLPACLTRYCRLHVNGVYYRYMIEYERPGEELMARYHREMRKKYPDLPREKVGHLFKSEGCNCDEGPYGWGDWRILNASCGHPKELRYAYTYNRKTYGWDDNVGLIRSDRHDDFIDMIEAMHAAKARGTEALREYFAEYFDLDLLLNYIAIINYAVPFDDMFQNHFIYQRLRDGKWLVMPWDLDQDFGSGWNGQRGLGPNSSIYIGEIGDPDNRSGWVHYMKDAFLKAYREEYEERLMLLNETVLHPDNIKRLVDDVTAQANPTEANAAAARLSCSFPSAASSFKSFADRRYAYISQLLREADAGIDRVAFVGEEIQFDASASRPDPGPNVSYTWSNGMTGEKPTWVFDAPGVFDLTLTIDSGSFQMQDTVKVTVLELPDRAYVEDGGLVAFEAEDFDENLTKGGNDSWLFVPFTVEASGRGFLEAIAASAYTRTGYSETSPELRYFIRFTEGGSWRVWIRGHAGTSSSDACYVGIDTNEAATSKYQRFTIGTSFAWSGVRASTQEQAILDVPGAGIHILSIWIRESSLQIDKIVLAKDTGYVPADLGPPASARETLGGVLFVRGDANPDGKMDLSDGISILGYIFSSQSIGNCIDRADANDDGQIDLADAIYMLAYIFSSGPEPPPPFPEPGADPTDDAIPCEAD
ncbi:MAG: lamin tail domain-containing protein [Planctomycetes bacterium]|nr:lamin tail domain-containing protein [Planctomycetota bacterium]